MFLKMQRKFLYTGTLAIFKYIYIYKCKWNETATSFKSVTNGKPNWLLE